MARSSRKAHATPPPVPSRSLRRIWPFVAVGLIVAAIGGVYLWSTVARRAPSAIILISIDTLRADRVGAYGAQQARTPAFDAFAKDAVLFERAYAHAPQTLPSHASMLTGLLPFEHGVRDNLGFILGDDKRTLASTLSAAGYRTGGFVSAYVLRPETGIGRGFGTFDADLPAASEERSIADVQRGGAATLAAAEKWLASQGDEKFFLFFHIYEPHKPYTPPAEFASLPPYDGEVAAADAIVGRLLDDLRRRGSYDAATIVITSDHGEGLGEHGEDEHGLFVYDSTMRVPLMVKLPGAKNGGRRIAGPAQHIDLAPTLAAMAGVTMPLPLRGRNLRAALEQGAAPAPQGVYGEALYARYHFGWSELQSLTDERYKFIKAPKAELYDLDRDPGEKTNVLTERAQVAQAMRGGLDALVAGRGLDSPNAVSAEDREKLAALGYIGSTSASVTTPGSTLPDPKDKAGVLTAYKQAVDEISEGRLAHAAELLKAIVAREPDMTDVWKQYGALLARMGRNADALAAFQAVLERQPTESIALVDTATLLMKLQRYREAREHAQLAVGSMPVKAHELLAKIALAQKDETEALKEAALAEQADPSLPMTDFVHGLIEHDAGRYDQALPYFQRASDRARGRTIQITDLRWYLGDTLARLDKYQEADRAFRDEIAVYPHNLRPRSSLAMLSAAAGQMATAEQIIAEMLKAIPTPEAYDQAAELWRLFNRPERAAAVRAERAARFGR
jgi:arylsulfatase A-like enzyme/predicted Zn-dependent protease